VDEVSHIHILRIDQKLIPMHEVQKIGHIKHHEHYEHVNIDVMHDLNFLTDNVISLENSKNQMEK